MQSFIQSGAVFLAVEVALLLLAAFMAVVAVAVWAKKRRRRWRLSRQMRSRELPRPGAQASTPSLGGRRTDLVTDEEWQSFREVKAGITGQKGEAAVAGALALLGVPALHNVILADSRGLTQIDHVVLGPDAIIVIETKTYSGFIEGDLHGEEWTQYHSQGAAHTVFWSPVRQNHRHRSAVLEIVAELAVPVRGYVMSAGKGRFCDALVGIVVPLEHLATIFLSIGATRTDLQALRSAWDRLVLAAHAGEARRAEHLDGVRAKHGLVAQ